MLFRSDKGLVEKLAFDDVHEDIKSYLENPTHLGMIQSSLQYADAVAKGEEVIPQDVQNYINEQKISLLEYCTKDQAKEVYNNFYMEEVINSN